MKKHKNRPKLPTKYIFVPPIIGCVSYSNIGGFQARDKTAMLVHKTMANLAHVLHNHGVKFPKDFFLFCSVHQHGSDDVR